MKNDLSEVGGTPHLRHPWKPLNVILSREYCHIQGVVPPPRGEAASIRLKMEAPKSFPLGGGGEGGECSATKAGESLVLSNGKYTLLVRLSRIY